MEVTDVARESRSKVTSYGGRIHSIYHPRVSGLYVTERALYLADYSTGKEIIPPRLVLLCRERERGTYTYAIVSKADHVL